MKNLRKSAISAVMAGTMCLSGIGVSVAPAFAYTYGQGYYGMGDGAHTAAQAVQNAKNAASKITSIHLNISYR